MKKTNQKFLIISIFILTIFGCKNEKNISNQSTSTFYDNQLTNKLIEFTAVDTIGGSTPNISKNYFFKFEGLTNDNQEIKITNQWVLDFVFIDLKGKSYFVPHYIFPNSDKEYPSNISIEEDFSINLVKSESEDFHFEIELCHLIDKAKIKRQSSKGITLKESKLTYSREIHKALLKSEENNEEIKKRIQNEDDDICRKIKITQKGYQVIFSEIKSQNLEQNLLPLFQSQNIQESGNLLDTMKIDKFIWKDFRRLYE